jgi:exodeoxyribonuclease VII large subunit
LGVCDDDAEAPSIAGQVAPRPYNHTMNHAPATRFQSAEAAIPVGELNRRVRQLIEQGMPLLWVRGELSNLCFAASGHLYFTLKDEAAQVGCVMFRSRTQLLGWRPAAGQLVEAQARPTIFEAGGRFQLQVEALRPSGQGELHARFLALRERLAAEGLFAAEAKRPLPAMPRRIGIVTSPQAAALRDVVTTLRRRAPHIDLVIYPTAVQGEGAAAQIVAALRSAERRQECELLILCRGGGSLEDLWSFNDETLARTLRSLRLPVVCGVGHETDFTIADFAADLRAPTPTAAAELASPDAAVLHRHLAERGRRLRAAAWRRLESAAQLLDQLGRRLRHPAETLRAARRRLGLAGDRLARLAAGILAGRRERLRQAVHRLMRNAPAIARLPRERQRLGLLCRRLQLAAERQQDDRRQRLAAIAGRLAALDPRQVLERGYAIVTDEAGCLVTAAAQVELNARIHVNLRSGRLRAIVDQKNETNSPESTTEDLTDGSGNGR